VIAVSLLGKAVSCAISVVKADRVQGRAATNRVQREISISVLVEPNVARMHHT